MPRPDFGLSTGKLHPKWKHRKQPLDYRKDRNQKVSALNGIKWLKSDQQRKRRDEYDKH